MFHGASLPAGPRERLIAAARVGGKAVVVEPAFDTIKRVRDGIVRESIDRRDVRWPLAWACLPEHQPQSDPPPAEWFLDALVVE